MLIDNRSRTRDLHEVVEEDRRKFLSMISFAIFGAVAASLGVASKRILTPVASAAKQAGATLTEKWKSLGTLAEISGDEPIERTLSIEKEIGWTRTIEDATVFVLPQHENRVVSSVCPHEGCPILWDKDRKNFVCPCHESYFSDAGERLTGPSTKDLTILETRVENGKLLVKL